MCSTKLKPDSKTNSCAQHDVVTHDVYTEVFFFLAFRLKKCANARALRVNSGLSGYPVNLFFPRRFNFNYGQVYRTGVEFGGGLREDEGSRI